MDSDSDLELYIAQLNKKSKDLQTKDCMINNDSESEGGSSGNKKKNYSKRHQNDDFSLADVRALSAKYGRKKSENIVVEKEAVQIKSSSKLQLSGGNLKLPLDSRRAKSVSFDNSTDEELARYLNEVSVYDMEEFGDNHGSADVQRTVSSGSSGGPLDLKNVLTFEDIAGYSSAIDGNKMMAVGSQDLLKPSQSSPSEKNEKITGSLLGGNIASPFYAKRTVETTEQTSPVRLLKQSHDGIFYSPKKANDEVASQSDHFKRHRRHSVTLITDSDSNEIKEVIAAHEARENGTSKNQKEGNILNIKQEEKIKGKVETVWSDSNEEPPDQIQPTKCHKIKKIHKEKPRRRKSSKVETSKVEHPKSERSNTMDNDRKLLEKSATRSTKHKKNEVFKSDHKKKLRHHSNGTERRSKKRIIRQALSSSSSLSQSDLISQSSSSESEVSFHRQRSQHHRKRSCNCCCHCNGFLHRNSFNDHSVNPVGQFQSLLGNTLTSSFTSPAWNSYSSVDLMATGSSKDSMMRHAQMVRHFLDTNLAMYNAYSAALSSHRHYSTLKETEEYIQRHRKPPLTFGEALKLVEQEMHDEL